VIATATSSAVPPAVTGHITFHVVVDHASRSFSMDDPNGLNGVRLHCEVLMAARSLRRKLWEFDIKAESVEHALAQMQDALGEYRFAGSWASANAN